MTEKKFPDWKAAEKHYNRQRFKDLRTVHALGINVHCCLDWLKFVEAHPEEAQAIIFWLNSDKEMQKQ